MKRHEILLFLVACSVIILGGSIPVLGAPIEIEVWGHETHMNYVEPMVEAFNAQQDDIVVKLIKREASSDRLIPFILAGVAPDIIYSAGAWDDSYINQGFFLELSQFAEDEPGFLEDFLPNVLRYADDGGIYSLPYTLQLMGAFHNPVVFAEAGLEPPQAGWTRDDLRVYSSKILRYENDRIVRWGAVPWTIHQLNMPLLSQTNVKLITQDYEVLPDPEPLQEMLSWAVEMAQRNLLTYRAEVGWTGTNFDYAHNTGIAFDASYRQNLWNELESPMTVIPMMRWDDSTTLKKGKPDYRSWAMITGHSDERQRAAWEFLKFLFEPENVAAFNIELGYPPSTISTAFSDDFRDYSMTHNPNMVLWITHYLADEPVEEDKEQTGMWPGEIATNVFPILESVQKKVLRGEISVVQAVEMLRSNFTTIVNDFQMKE
ncbi:MAG: extracellular solute-binding protein [Limnochordia bacterium]|nr:extracellular solute-binding protein [Limnochordia bacterium]